MDSVEGAPDNGAQDLTLVDPLEWDPGHTQGEMGNNNNSTLLYIAVEYVKDFKLDNGAVGTSPPQVIFNDYDPHVSPLDPNMSSVARYSPVYNEPSTEYNPIVIHQLVAQDSNSQNEQFPNSTLETMPPTSDLTNQEVNNQFLQMSGHPINSNVGESFQLVPENEQEVELLITDQETGISYSVSTQELLVERCLQDEQLLDPLLDTDLLALDDNTLKSELNDEMMDATVVTQVDAQVVSNYINSMSGQELNLPKNLDEVMPYKMETRQRQNNLDPEEQLLSCVYSITDKPILSRARASLPESYLVINKIDNENDGVFAKKTIPMRTQFGPLEGVIKQRDDVKFDGNGNSLDLFIEDSNQVYRMDVADEDSSNWMGFVRKATNFDEQNLVLSQETGGLFFTTTKTIQPKQELKVGYSSSYAQTHQLAVLQPKILPTWPCFECSAKFTTSDELQKHLNVHDEDKTENVKPRKKLLKCKKRFLRKHQLAKSLECSLCGCLLAEYTYSSLRKHLSEAHNLTNGSVQDNFVIITNHKCDMCETGFKSEALLKIHNLEHDPDSAEEQANHVCPSCQRKFPTQRQLVLHVMQHALPKKIVQAEIIKCPVCYKSFALRERLQRHMLVHGSEESKPLQCKICCKRFLNNSALACHLKTHYTDKKLFECPICKERFDNVLKLKLHVPRHCINNQYTCPHCKKIFKKYSIIRKHIRAFHCERKHNCQQCTKSFPTLDKLRMHLLRHSDHREFLCADCGKQFKRKDKLKEHCKRMHSEERENTNPKPTKKTSNKKFSPKVEPQDFHRFIYKCHSCLVGFKRRGMLVNHLAKRHPDIPPDSVPELNLPILQTTRDYYCQYCDKVYKSSSKRKAHILKNHPGAALPMSNRKTGSVPDESTLPNPTFSQTVGSITTTPQSCKWCHKQYASKAKLLQHQRKKHAEQLTEASTTVRRTGLRPIAAKLEEVTLEQTQISERYKKDPEITVVDHVITSGYEEPDYCQLSEADTAFMETAMEFNNPNSHLYRLLTTSSNGMLPPR